jgi:membrane protein implicated in regulation of membrane protease activity
MLTPTCYIKIARYLAVLKYVEPHVIPRIATVWKREYTTITIIVSLLEGAAIIAIVLWLLPKWDIRIPSWGLMLILLAFGAYQFVTYWLGKRALGRKPVVSADAMVGHYGKATTPLAPDGYVQLDGELWRASSVGSHADRGDEVVVREVKGLTLLVIPRANRSSNGGG